MAGGDRGPADRGAAAACNSLGVLAMGFVGLTLLAAADRTGDRRGAESPRARQPSARTRRHSARHRRRTCRRGGGGRRGRDQDTRVGAVPCRSDLSAPCVPALEQAIDPIAGFLTRMAVLVTVARHARPHHRVVDAPAMAADRDARGARLPGRRSAVGHASHRLGSRRHRYGGRAGRRLRHVAAIRPDAGPARARRHDRRRRHRARHAGPFPGALTGALAGLVVIGAMAWLWFRALRRVAAPAIHPAT